MERKTLMMLVELQILFIWNAVNLKIDLISEERE